MYTPVAGRVTAVNAALEQKPGLVNSSCYTDGWLFKLDIACDDDFNGLMTQADYDKFLKTIKH